MALVIAALSAGAALAVREIVARRGAVKGVAGASGMATGSEGVPACCAVPTRFPTGPTAAPAGMRWIPGGEFTMGSDDAEARPDEKPRHRVRVNAFWMDETEVTNAQFRAFVDATGYVTTAERAPVLEEIMKQLPPGTPPPPKEALVPSSLVFNPPPGPVALDNHAVWWTWAQGANWRQPEGAGSTIEGKDNHPAVHVSWDDAVAYCKWAGKRLPTEAEWEFAARGGLEGKPYVWGDEKPSEEKPQANIWQGSFPNGNTNKDGFARTAPVRSFAPNGYGLYDVAGNVWEWCSDWYRNDTYAITAAAGAVAVNPQGPDSSFDPSEPTIPKRVQRGGSFLCHATYCASYRPSARMKTSPDTSLSHAGFRGVMDPAPPPATRPTTAPAAP
jgi:formylglycine-generating enzyme required for sulfatase activity